MRFRIQRRAALFVDGAMLSITARGLGGQIDAVKLRKFVEDHVGKPMVSYYFDAARDGQHSAYHRAWAHNGFRVKVHPTVSRDGSACKQLGVDVGLAIATVRSQLRDRWSKLVLVAGDGDFFPLVADLVEEHSVDLTLITSRAALSPFLSPYANRVYFMDDVWDLICRQEFKPAC